MGVGVGDKAVGEPGGVKSCTLPFPWHLEGALLWKEVVYRMEYLGWRGPRGIEKEERTGSSWNC